MKKKLRRIYKNQDRGFQMEKWKLGKRRQGWKGYFSAQCWILLGFEPINASLIF